MLNRMEHPPTVYYSDYTGTVQYYSILPAVLPNVVIARPPSLPAFASLFSCPSPPPHPSFLSRLAGWYFHSEFLTATGTILVR